MQPQGRATLFLVLALIGLITGLACETGWTHAENLSGAGPQIAPVWSPDSTWIAFGNDTGLHGTSLSEDYIYVIKADGSSLSRISDPPERDTWYADYSPSVSPAGSRIAFTTYRHRGPFPWFGDRSLEIGSSAPDGSDYRRLTDHKASDTNPAWSPDGTRIAFLSDRGEDVGLAIYVMNADGSEVQRITPQGLRVRNSPPSWSPDGRHIAFLTQGNDPTLHIIGADGSNWIKIADTTYGLSWSPDGKRLAFVFRSKEDPPIFNLYTATPDGTSIQKIPMDYIISDVYSGRYLSWSPDGSETRFFGRLRLPGQTTSTGVHALQVDGSGLRTIIELRSTARISFSPDDSSLAIRHNRSGYDPDVGEGAVIYRVTTHGTDTQGLVWEEIGQPVTKENRTKATQFPTSFHHYTNPASW